jgi:hypothetical protein
MSKKSEEEKLLEVAKKRFDKITKEYSYTHKISRMCHEFISGKQWDDEHIKTRGDAPTLTVNKLASRANNVVNKSSMEDRKITALPFEAADKDKARVFNGLIRHIQYSDVSDAAIAFNGAMFDTVVGGFGYWGIDSDYTDENSMDQDISIYQIEDPFSVFISDKKDFAFVIKCISNDEYKEKYGDETPSDWETTEFIKKPNEDDVVLLEYWEKTKTQVTIYKIEIPERLVIEQSEINIEDEISAIAAPEQEYKPATVRVVTEEDLAEVPEYSILEQRESYKETVRQYILSSDKVLKKCEWDGKYIPIVRINSRKFDTKDGWFWKPLVYDSIDSQKFYNFNISQVAEMLMQQPLMPWIGAEGQFVGHENEFARANIDRIGYAEYKPLSIGGQLAPPPQRVQPPQISPANLQGMQQATDDIAATMGVYDASVGSKSNETSGRAILAREEQGDANTYHFTLAEKNGFRETGLILFDLIPKKYDTARTIRILGDDMKDEVVRINEEFQNEKGEKVLYDMTTGKYDLKISAGSSSVTRMMDTAENLLEFAKTLPNSGMVIGDLIAKNLSFENSDELSNRLKAMIPAEVFQRMEQNKRSEENGVDPSAQQQQMVMQKMQDMQQQLMGAQQAIQQLSKENNTLKQRDEQAKIQIAQMQMNGRIQEQQMQNNTDIKIAQMNNQNDIQQEIIRRQPYPGNPMRGNPDNINNAAPNQSGLSVRVSNNRPLGN